MLTTVYKSGRGRKASPITQEEVAAALEMRLRDCGQAKIALALGVSADRARKIINEADKLVPAPTRRRVPDAATFGPVLQRRLEKAVSEILCPRTAGLLEKHGILFVNDLLHRTEAELLAIRHLNSRTLESIYEALARLGFHRRGHEPDTETTR